jgi:hypothetical protein
MIEWLVTWGRPGRVDWRVVRVMAHDAEEALVIARELHPDLPPPQVALPST